MLIRNAEIEVDDNGHRAVRDVRIAGRTVAAVAPRLDALPDEPIIEADGGALLPGLNDHHIHLAAFAAALDSLQCGPPEVMDGQQLATTLQQADRQADGSWLRGIGYHESVAGDLDRDWLDRHIGRRPVRIQHRSGRLWIFNSLGLATLGITASGDDPFERLGGRPTGRLYDADAWLRTHLPSRPPDLRRASALLARHGITGITDTSHGNNLDDYAYFTDARRQGLLLQDAIVMGDASLDSAAGCAGVDRGATKFHLHDNDLPDFDRFCDDIRRSHGASRPVAFHCVTRADLTFALSALTEAGSRAGDRIEHAAIAPPDAVATMRQLGVTVVTQPHFIAERGDVYLHSVDADDLPWLYRLRGLLDAGVPLAAGSDAPYGSANPWLSMEAAVTRQTLKGRRLGPAEALSPERALALFTAPLAAPGTKPPHLAAGAVASCCLLDRSWASARRRFSAVTVRSTIVGGSPVWSA